MLLKDKFTTKEWTIIFLALIEYERLVRDGNTDLSAFKNIPKQNYLKRINSIRKKI